MNPVQFLAFRAAFNRTDIAAVTRDKVHTYHAMHGHVRAVAARLRDEGIGPGQTVAVYVRDQYLHLTTVLALLHEGVTQVSGDASYGPLPRGLLLDAVVADRNVPGLASVQMISIGEDWLTRPPKGANVIMPRAYPDPETPCRIDSSSGTTGEAKAIPISAEKLGLRVVADSVVNPPTGPMLTPVGLGVGWGLSQPLVSIFCGRPIVFTAFQTGEDVLSMKTYRISLFVASVFQANMFMDYVEKRGISLPDLRCVHVGGAGVTPKLMARIQRLLNPNIIAAYGASECSFIAVAGADMVERAPEGVAGRPVPDARVEIVDESDSSLPAGREGIVRIHRANAATEYLNDPKATARTFRDGWFYPGDVGYLTEGGLVVVTGRVDEIINVGGGKINPVRVDEFFADLPGVGDAAAFAMVDVGGVTRVWVAIVPAEGYDEDALRRRCAARFGKMAPEQYVRVKEIPRNRLGKVVRRELVGRASSNL